MLSATERLPEIKQLIAQENFCNSCATSDGKLQLATRKNSQKLSGEYTSVMISAEVGSTFFPIMNLKSSRDHFKQHGEMRQISGCLTN
jgi:hypothetical protein